MHSCSTPSACTRCSISVSGSAKAAGRRSRCRSSTRPSPSSPRWRPSATPASPMPGAELRGLAAAFAFLTRVPVGRWVDLDAADVARGGALFPLVGAGIGLVVGGVAQSTSGALTAPLAAVLGIAAGTVLTGVLHLDGLADTADAFGATTRERALEIMRDHAVGAYGTVAVVLDLGLKTAALAVLASRHDAMRYAVCVTAAARAVPVVLSAALPYARTSGTGNALRTTGIPRVVVAVAIAVAL